MIARSNLDLDLGDIVVDWWAERSAIEVRKVDVHDGRPWEVSFGATGEYVTFPTWERAVAFAFHVADVERSEALLKPR